MFLFSGSRFESYLTVIFNFFKVILTSGCFFRKKKVNGIKLLYWNYKSLFLKCGNIRLIQTMIKHVQSESRCVTVVKRKQIWGYNFYNTVPVKLVPKI